MQVLCLYIDRGNLSQDWRVNYANSNILWHFLTAIIWHTWWFFWQIQNLSVTLQFLLFLFFNLGQFPSRSPRGFVFGGAIYRRVFCVTSLGGLYLEGLIFVILLYLARETSEMFRHLEVTTETTQPRPQVSSVNGSIIWQWRHFEHIAKFFQIWSTIAGCDELCLGF